MANKRKVVILNDDPDLVEMMTQILTEAGYEVTSSLVRELDVVLNAQPDIVLLDCPPGEEKEILTFAQKLRLSKVAHIPILLGTSSLRHIQPEILRDKLILVLVRPYGAEELLQGIETLLNDSDNLRREPG